MGCAPLVEGVPSPSEPGRRSVRQGWAGSPQSRDLPGKSQCFPNAVSSALRQRGVTGQSRVLVTAGKGRAGTRPWEGTVTSLCQQGKAGQGHIPGKALSHPCAGRERQGRDTSLGKQCHTSQGRQCHTSQGRQSHVPVAAGQCHIPAKELSHAREGRADHSEAWRHVRLCPCSSGLPSPSSSPGSPHACSGLCTMPCCRGTNFLGEAAVPC